MGGESERRGGGREVCVMYLKMQSLIGWKLMKEMFYLLGFEELIYFFYGF